MDSDRARAGAVGAGDRRVIVVPWRDKGDRDRRANFDAVLDHLTGLGVGPVAVADDGRLGPFNRSAAYNRGRAAHPSDVYVWHEADMLLPADQLEAGVRLALESPGLVVPFTEYRYLSAADSGAVRDGQPPEAFRPEFLMGGGKSIGAVGITSEETMRLVGRWDEKFAGWGHDDNAMFRAFTLCAGPARWVEGPGYHLWHPPGMQTPVVEEQDATNDNYRRWLAYKAAATPEEVRALTCEP